ncbi:hypothetical protein N836_29095 [Leptolyngbya sp. Heron Island J]|uniref:DUF309 domain-containing protein n=1 Tax=Leptolyngbya sp. Heron Island J TaxID=1385935 RepID=UPI0003B971DE|nr:DUF309 domain-containing protein [Leptolyngbya sp. Heron Island J]ESA39013.1 hypothetical protein N836_29095 [Leptolyngbya sp. Heron Island J]
MINASNSLSSSHQPVDFWVGIEQFNQGEYYACHDTLEAIWLEANPHEQAFYQGILQIAVGLYHLTNLNWKGAAILLGEGSHRLLTYEANHGGIDVSDLIDQATDWLTALQATGPDHIQHLAPALLDESPETMKYVISNGNTLMRPCIHRV